MRDVDCYSLKNSYINYIARKRFDRDEFPRERRKFQNQIIRTIFNHSSYEIDFNIRQQDHTLWLTVIVGLSRSGRDKVMNSLLEENLVPLINPIIIEIEEIRQLLLEDKNNETNETNETEVLFIFELLVQISLSLGRHVILAGLQMNCHQHKQYFQSLQSNHPQLKLLFIHTTIEETPEQRKVTETWNADQGIETSINDWKHFHALEDSVNIFLCLSTTSNHNLPIILYPWFMRL